MEVASRLSMPLGETLERVSYPEFLLWMAKFQKEENDRWQKQTPDHWYFAQLTAKVVNLFREHPIEMDAMLLRFGKPKPKQPHNDDPLSNKHIWMGILGLKPDKD